MNLALSQICNIYNTDKNSYHSYIDQIYEDLFKDIRYSAKKILEIGVDSGASLLMWKEYFENAEIYGIDEKDCVAMMGRDRVNFLLKNAYDQTTVNDLPNNFDVIIDDGPHTLDSMRFSIEHYLNKLNKNGILILEDLQDFHWSNILRKYIPNNYTVDIKDLRKIRNRYDDIAMVIRQIKV